MRIDIPPDFYAQKRTPVGRAALKSGGQQQKTFGEIAIQNADLSELFQNVYDSAFLTELNGKIVDANVRASQSFLYSREQFKLGAIMDIVMGMTENVLLTVEENLQNDRFTLIQAECARQDGSLMPSEISTCKVNLSGKTYLCFFIRDVSARKESEDALQSAHDDLEQEVRERTRINEELKLEIAERKRIEAELNSAIETLQKHDRAKTQFVSNVSHELKTPLSSINYIAGNMQKGIAGPLNQQGRTYLSMIREDCHRLQRTVDDILDMSRIESNTLRMNLAKVNFGRFAQRTIESLRMQIEAEGLSLDSAVDPHGFSECDPQKIERVIFNIVKNAMKYNIKGGVIKARLTPSKALKGMHVLDVIDSGIGIEAKDLPRITERFFRVGEYVSGAGLGLAICKDLLAQHGGGIQVTSPPAGMRKGTQVSISLPATAPPLVLLACGDDQVERKVTTQMKNYGYRVVTGKLLNGTLHSAMQKEIPDLIILEWIQKGMDGGIVIAMIKGEESMARVPILAITDMEPSLTKQEILDGFLIPRLLPSWSEDELWGCVEELVLGRKRLDV